MGALIGALGVGLMPGGQQFGVTDQPVAAARETQPARGADSWRQQRLRGKGKKKRLAIIAVSKGRALFDGNILLTAQRPLAHVGALLIAFVTSPFAILV